MLPLALEGRNRIGEWAAVFLMTCCANKCLVNEYGKD